MRIQSDKASRVIFRLDRQEPETGRETVFRFISIFAASLRRLAVLLVLIFAGVAAVACQRESSPPEGKSPAEDRRIKADWSAWVNKMPPGPASFHVSGVLHMPHPGFEATLMPTRPQGINPKVLMMDLKVEELDGMWAQVLTDIEVKYVEDPYEADYEQVHIFYPNGDSVFLELTVAY